MDARDDEECAEVEIAVPGARLVGDLITPHEPAMVVLFAHGSGSSRKSARNRAVARSLQDAGMATLLLDLLTPVEGAREEAGGVLRFDVELLAGRLIGAIGWLGREPRTRALQVGLFGASTGAAAALIAAARLPAEVGAVVSRGGRPDLAGRELERVSCPTLLIVGGADTEVLELNRLALRRLRCAKQLAIVPGATHLFEEPSALQEVARLAAAWFAMSLRNTTEPGPAS